MRLLRFGLLTAFILFTQNTFACINEYRTLLNGKVVMEDGIYGIVYPEQPPEDLEEQAALTLAKYRETDSIEYYSDYGAALVYLGRHKEARRIFQEIERKHPGLYTTAANLGTVYELLGNNDSAYYWIKRGMELNPGSHTGSEWIHLKILEFKRSGSTDYSKSILGLDFGQSIKPENPMGYDLVELERQIRIQLSERLFFIGKPDKIMGNIYFDYGNVLAHTSGIEPALEAYEEAKAFGFSGELMESRISGLSPMTREAAVRTYLTENLGVIAIAVLIFTFTLLTLATIWVIRRVRRRRLRNAT